MSAINGDKARFHRQRKAKIARRVRNQKHFDTLKHPSKSASVHPTEQKTVAA
jgi:hypothetical protein